MADDVEKIIIEVEERGVQSTDKSMEDLNETLRDNKKANEEASEEQEEYNKTLGDTIKDTKIFGVSLNSLSASFKATTGAIKASVSGLKLFKIALAATGIGLLVIALGSLVTFFTRSQEGSDKLSKALRIVGNIINVLLDRVSDFGGGLMKLFSGDIKGGLSDMRNAFVGIGDAITENIARAIELERQMIQLREASLNLTIQEAGYRQRIAESREVMNDTNKLMSERLKAGQDALVFEKQLANARIFNLELQKTMLEEGLKESDSRHEDLVEIANLEAQIINAETARAQASIRVRNRLQSLEREDLAEREKNYKDHLDRLATMEGEKAQEESTARTEQNTERVIEWQNLSDQEQQIAKETSKALGLIGKHQAVLNKQNQKERVLLEDETNEAVLDGRVELLGGIAALFGQESKLGKAAAISQAIINTWRGVSSVIADTLLPTVAKPAFIAATIAQGLAAVRRITAVSLPQIQIKESSFAEGGHISGASHNSRAGGVRILAEGGEFIMNKKSMAMPGVAGLMESINSLGSRGASSPGIFAQGGYVPSNLEQMNLEQAIQSQRPVLVIEDFFTEVNSIQVTEDLSSL